MISLSYFAVSTFHGRAQSFPTVWIIGFAPHLAVLYVIILCGAIYGLATIFTGGTADLQATVQTVNISLAEDFYSCLLKLGILVLTSAADATYMTEGPSLAVPATTWIEALEFQKKAGFEYINDPPDTSSTPALATGSLRHRVKISTPTGGDYTAFSAPNKQRRRHSRSGRRRSSVGFSSFSVSSTATQSDVGSGYASHNVRVGSGADASSGSEQRRKGADRFRWLVIVYRVRMAYRLVLWTTRVCKSVLKRAAANARIKLFGSGGDDFEDEDNRIAMSALAERLTDDDYYSAFVTGTELPDIDESGEFDPDPDDEDYDEDLDDDDEEEEDFRDEERRVVTTYSEQDLFPELEDSDISLLSLLNPQSREERHLANVMRAHLSTNQILTRNRMIQQEVDDEGWETDDSTDSEYETANLLALIAEIRSSRKVATTINSDDDDEDATYQPSLCVVCHCNQRNIVLWPCKCLAVCEDCRVSLAVRNFKGCVCCRRDVVSFSRLYVP